MPFFFHLFLNNTSFLLKGAKQQQLAPQLNQKLSPLHYLATLYVDSS